MNKAPSAVPDMLLDQKAVARLLGTTVKFLEARRVRGGGPVFYKIGALVRYRRSDVENWILSRQVGSMSESIR